MKIPHLKIRWWFVPASIGIGFTIGRVNEYSGKIQELQIGLFVPMITIGVYITKRYS